MALSPHSTNPRNLWHRGRPLLCLSLLLLLLGGAVGCTRHFFRNRADLEVSDVLKEKDQYPFWKIEQFYVYPNDKARFADPSNPDHPPMPPDDPAAWKLAPRPQQPGKAGVAHVEGDGYVKLLQQWDQENRARRAEEDSKLPSLGQPPQGDTPESVSVVPGTGSASSTEQTADNCNPPPGPFLLNLEQAVELGLINSREYQGRREDLYLTALPVTAQRFSFMAQAFIAEQTIRQWAGPQSTVGEQNRWIANSGGGVTKLFSTGALLVVRAANQTVWNMTGSVTHGLSSTSTINLDFIQPFLRGGGRAVTLEPLTQAERNLVYEIRSFARFRKQFYAFVAGGVGPFPGATPGGDLTNRTVPAAAFGGLITPGIFSTPVGLIGSQGLAGGGVVPPPLSPQFSPGSSGSLNLANAVLAPSTGYLPSLLAAAVLSNDRKNVLALQKALKLFEGFEEGGDVSPLQVSLVKVQLLNGQNKVLTDAQTLRTDLDQLKYQLGLPINFLIELDDTPVRSLNRHLLKYEQILTQFDALFKTVQQQDQQKAAEMRNFLRKLLTSDALVEGTNFQKNILKQWDEWQNLPDQTALLKKLSDLRTQRRKLLDAKTDAEVAGKPFPAEQAKELGEVDFQLRLGDLQGVVRDFENRIWQKQPTKDLQDRERTAVFRALVNAFVLVLVEARNERLGKLRQEWPEPPAIELEGCDLLKEGLEQAQQACIKAALDNRLDVMNQRAQVTDAWRQLRVVANTLLGTFNVGYHMDTVSRGMAQPLNFAASSTNNQLYFTVEPPLVRVTQRNNYRAALIAYQRERRYLMSVEDSVAANVRQEIRQLRLLWQNYKIQKEVVDLAYQQVESSLETFAAPPGAGATTGNAGNAAALTTQYLNSQANLVTAQNNLYTIWVNYLVARQTLYLDLELMPLDFRGVWKNEFGLSDQSQSPGGAGAERQSPAGGDQGGPAEDIPAPRLLPPAIGGPAGPE